MGHHNDGGIWPDLLSARGLWVILVGFMALAWAYGLVIPAFENLDEVEHFSAIRYVAEAGALPVHDPVLQERYHYRQEASQPPLYYILMGGLTRLFGLPTDDTNSHLVTNPFVACGPSGSPYNKHMLYHNPSQEAFSLAILASSPWKGALLTLHVLRALTPLLQLFTIVGAYAIARLILPQYPGVALLAAALTAFNPQFLLVSSGVNNDNLVTPLATMGVYLALLTHHRGPSIGRSLGLGVLAGLASLSKLSGLLVLALAGLILLDAARRSRGWRRSIGHGLLIGAVTTVICGWWFLRNWQLYGDLTALEPMLEWVGRRTSSTLPLNESGLMFRSFWGQLPCLFFGDWFYLLFALLTAAGLLGLLVSGFVSGRKGWPHSRSWAGMFWLAVWFGIVYIGWLQWGSITAATGGRLLFPAIASTSTLLAYGLLRFWPSAWRGRVAAAIVIFLAGTALVTLRWELSPTFSAPRTYPEADLPNIPYPLEATFGSTATGEPAPIGLRGYDAEVKGEAPYLDVTLYWQALVPISHDYALAIQLASPVPGDNSLRFNYNTWPGRGNYPTTAWSPGEIIVDHYDFKLPASDAPTQAWQLLVAFYELESGQRLPVRIDTQDVGKALILTTLRVPGRPTDCPVEAVWDEPVDFGLQHREPFEGMIALTGAYVFPAPASADSGLEVSLCWESLAPTPVDYTIFAHLYDKAGELVATGDGPPMGGAFPTRLWLPGDEVVDRHLIPVADPGSLTKSGHRVGVGLYDLRSGERLQAVQGDQPTPDNVVLLDIIPKQ